MGWLFTYKSYRIPRKEYFIGLRYATLSRECGQYLIRQPYYANASLLLILFLLPEKFPNKQNERTTFLHKSYVKKLTLH